jgi:uncharacterized membrane protein
MDQDGAFGVQTLVDIAERSLTDSFNDQTTAAQAIDRLHDILRSLARRRFPSGRFAGSDDRVRLIVPELGWGEYVALAFDQISIVAEGSPAVMQRIEDALRDLLTVAPANRRRPVEVRLRKLESRSHGADDEVSRDASEEGGRRAG